MLLNDETPNYISESDYLYSKKSIYEIIDENHTLLKKHKLHFRDSGEFDIEHNNNKQHIKISKPSGHYKVIVKTKSNQPHTRTYVETTMFDNKALVSEYLSQIL